MANELATDRPKTDKSNQGHYVKGVYGKTVKIHGECFRAGLGGATCAHIDHVTGSPLPVKA